MSGAKLLRILLAICQLRRFWRVPHCKLQVLLRLEDNRLVETVGIPVFGKPGKIDRLTACVSSQVPSALDCEWFVWVSELHVLGVLFGDTNMCLTVCLCVCVCVSVWLSKGGMRLKVLVLCDWKGWICSESEASWNYRTGDLMKTISLSFLFLFFLQYHCAVFVILATDSFLLLAPNEWGRHCYDSRPFLVFILSENDRVSYFFCAGSCYRRVV